VLKTLILHSNELMGAVPAELGNLAALQVFIHLGENQMSMALGNLAALQAIYLLCDRGVRIFGISFE